MAHGQLRARTVRLSATVDDAVRASAEEEGITVSQFIREAVLSRLTLRWCLEHPDQAADLEQTLRDIRDGTI